MTHTLPEILRLILRQTELEADLTEKHFSLVRAVDAEDRYHRIGLGLTHDETELQREYCNTLRAEVNKCSRALNDARKLSVNNREVLNGLMNELEVEISVS